jgi:hypothetical protein
VANRHYGTDTRSREGTRKGYNLVDPIFPSTGLCQSTAVLTLRRKERRKEMIHDTRIVDRPVKNYLSDNYNNEREVVYQVQRVENGPWEDIPIVVVKEE